MQNNLSDNLELLHTTELGIMRIKRNLELDCDDVVGWCTQKIRNADSITRKGKNWYASYDNIVITVNARSFTIITAHKHKKTNTLTTY